MKMPQLLITLFLFSAAVSCRQTPMTVPFEQPLRATTMELTFHAPLRNRTHRQTLTNTACDRALNIIRSAKITPEQPGDGTLTFHASKTYNGDYITLTLPEHEGGTYRLDVSLYQYQLLCDVSQAKELLVRTILELPEYCIWEESTDTFKQRLQQGHYWYDSRTDTDYLFIDGDGCYSKRLFSMNPSHGLRVYDRNRGEDNQPDSVSLYQYDGKQLNYVSDVPSEQMDNLLPAQVPVR